MTDPKEPEQIEDVANVLAMIIVVVFVVAVSLLGWFLAYKLIYYAVKHATAQ